MTNEIHLEYLNELNLGKLYVLSRQYRSIYSEPNQRAQYIGTINNGMIAMMIGKHIDTDQKTDRFYNTANWAKILSEHLIGWVIVHEGDWNKIDMPDYLK